MGNFLFLHELVNIPLHALELFFAVTITGGTLRTGHDPELAPDQQLIAEATFKSLPEIKNIPPPQLHRLFSNLHHLDDLYRQAPIMNPLNFK